MKKLFVITIVLLSILACNNKDGYITLVESAGNINHLTIVIDNGLWKGSVGDSLREIIGAPILGLPQEENQFSVTQVPPKTFGRLFKTSRNILFIGIEDKVGYGVKKNLYASPQMTMTIIGKDRSSLTDQINTHKDEIISVFKTADLKLFQKKITKKHWDTKDVKTLLKLGIQLKIPKNYAMVKDTGDFLWFRQDINKGSLNIISYALPLLDNNNVENGIVAARDTIGKKYIPGQFDGTYMITEAAYTPFTKQTIVSNNSSFETRGKWEVKGDFMAGPFLNYTVIDKENNRLIVVEGFTYAPSIRKRDYMFELEAILKTLKI
jgi:hypothetical protein